MEVYDFDGARLGQVKEARDADFSVSRAWRADRRVPLDRVLAVMDRRVMLTLRGHQAGSST